LRRCTEIIHFTNISRLDKQKFKVSSTIFNRESVGIIKDVLCECLCFWSPVSIFPRSHSDIMYLASKNNVIFSIANIIHEASDSTDHFYNVIKDLTDGHFDH